MANLKNVSLGDAIRALTAAVELTEPLVKDYVSETEFRFHGQFTAREGRIYTDDKQLVHVEGELFSGLNYDAALDGLEQRNADEALSRKSAPTTTEGN